jgi:hypothetical protein
MHEKALATLAVSDRWGLTAVGESLVRIRMVGAGQPCGIGPRLEPPKGLVGDGPSKWPTGT